MGCESALSAGQDRTSQELSLLMKHASTQASPLKPTFPAAKLRLDTVDIAQMVERQIVVLDVAGSSPVIHPVRCEPPVSTGGSLHFPPGIFEIGPSFPSRMES